MKIIICEDDPIYRRFILKELTSVIKQEQINCKIELCTGDPNMVMKYANDMDDIIYFLDIEYMNFNITGIDIAKEIRKYNINCPIVFITSHSEKAMEAYKHKLELFNFLDKYQSDIVEDLKSTMLEAIERTSRPVYATLHLKTKTREQKLPYRDILHIQAVKNMHSVCITTTRSISKFSISLNEIMKLLDPNIFKRVSKSVIINTAKIIDVKTDYVILSNGEKIDCSKNYFDPFVANLREELINA